MYLSSVSRIPSSSRIPPLVSYTTLVSYAIPARHALLSREQHQHPPNQPHRSIHAYHSSTVSHTGNHRPAPPNRSSVSALLAAETDERSAIPQYVTAACQ